MPSQNTAPRWVQDEQARRRRDNAMFLPGLDPPEHFAGGYVVAAIRLPVIVRLLTARHAIVVKHNRGEEQTFSVHEVGRQTSASDWTGLSGVAGKTWDEAIQLMAVIAAGAER